MTNEQKPLEIDHDTFVRCQFLLRDLIERLINAPIDEKSALMQIAAMEIAKAKLIEKFSL
ncbi:MAG TPA: hypothetical protein VH815_11615 [Acidobacteriota bacterium]|jgi:hypothetical protein